MRHLITVRHKVSLVTRSLSLEVTTLDVKVLCIMHKTHGLTWGEIYCRCHPCSAEVSVHNQGLGSRRGWILSLVLRLKKGGKKRCQWIKKKNVVRRSKRVVNVVSVWKLKEDKISVKCYGEIMGQGDWQSQGPGWKGRRSMWGSHSKIRGRFPNSSEGQVEDFIINLQ